MRTTICFFLLLGYLTPGKAQITHPSSIGLNTTGLFIGKTFKAVASPQIFWTEKRHQFGFGPAFMFVTVSAVSNNDFPKLVGVQGNYTFYPNGRNNKVNLLLFNEFNAYRIKDTWTSVIWNSTEQNYILYKYQSIEYLFHDLTGYGIELLLGKRFVLKSTVGIGLYYSVQGGTTIGKDIPEIDMRNVNGYQPFNVSYGLNIGLIYTL